MEIPQLFFYIIVFIISVYFIKEIVYSHLLCSGQEGFLSFGTDRPSDVAASDHLKKVETGIYSIRDNNPEHDHNLRDYYIFSSYSSPNVGTFKETKVSNAQIKELLRLGVRVIDLEVFTLNKKPVFAASNSENVFEKKSYNHLDAGDTLDLIRRYAFSAGTAPNFNDPLIIHYRLRTKHKQSLNELAKLTSYSLQGKLLGEKHGHENHQKNIGTMPLKELRGKCIIMVTKADEQSYDDSKLFEIANISTSSPFLQTLQHKDVIYAPSIKDLVNINKKNMTFSIPDEGKNPKNCTVTAHQAGGVQMIGMNFQKNDNQLQSFVDYFASKKTAFVLKPEPMRYIPIVIPDPKPQRKELSYARKPVEGDGFKFEL